MTVIQGANFLEKFCVVGAGIVGQLIALALLDRGWRAGVVLESSMPPASLAGGGILSPMFPWRYTSALNNLAESGCNDYAVLVNRLGSAGHLSEGAFFRSGIWMELQSEEEASFDRWERYTSQKYVIQSRLLAGEPRSGVYFPELGSIISPSIMKGLRSYLISRGVRFLPVQALDWQASENAVNVRLAGGGKLVCETLIVAAGAGARRLLETRQQQFPAKGEMLMYRLGDKAPKELILAREGYAIPRSNGDTVVGSTLQPGDDTTYPTVTGRYRLTEIAEKLLPQCKGIRPDSHWAGVRPGLSRDYPYIGCVPGHKNVFAAVGHYRNGLVCAPASATLLSQIILGEETTLNPGDYSLSSS